MVSAVIDICILIFAEITHGKIHHGCVVPVIRYLVYDGVSGAAFHAAYERMLIPRVAFRVKLVEAVGADRQISGEHGRFIVAFCAGDDGERVEVTKRNRLAPDVDYFGRSRLVGYVL